MKSVRKHSKILKTDHGQTELNIMLVKKSSLNEIDKAGIQYVSRTEGRSKESISKFKRPSKLVDKVDYFKASAEKSWLLYEFPFSLNPGDKPNVA